MWKQWLTLFLGGFKVTADGDWSHEIKRCLLPGRKVMTNLDSILKSRDIILPTKVHLVEAMVFPVVRYGCELVYKESWVPKKCFWTAVLEKTLESPLDPTSPSKRKPVLNIHWKDWCWSWNSSNLTTWCEELTHLKRPQCWERLKVGGEGRNRGWGHWMASPTRWTWVWVNSGSWWWTGRPSVLQFMGLQRVGHNWGTELTALHTMGRRKYNQAEQAFSLQNRFHMVTYVILSGIQTYSGLSVV